MATEAHRTMSSSVESSRYWCSKCGAVKKSGKFSCCARGGTWFKKCGDADDKKFDHTWSEGIKVCKGFASSMSVKSPLQLTPRPLEVIVYRPSTSKRRNTTQKHTHTDRSDNMSSVGTTTSEDCIELTKIVICVAGLFITFSNILCPLRISIDARLN